MFWASSRFFNTRVSCCLFTFSFIVVRFSFQTFPTFAISFLPYTTLPFCSPRTERTGAVTRLTLCGDARVRLPPSSLWLRFFPVLLLLLTQSVSVCHLAQVITFLVAKAREGFCVFTSDHLQWRSTRGHRRMSSPEAALRGMMDTAVAAHSSVPVATAPFLHLIQFHDDGNTKVGLRCCSVGATPSETLTTSAAPTIASIESQQKTMRCSHETAALNETKDYGKPKIFAPDALLAAAPTPTSVDPILLEDLDKEKLKLLFTPAFYSRTQRWVSQPQKSPPHLDLTRESIVQDFRHKSLYIFLVSWAFLKQKIVLCTQISCANLNRTTMGL